MLLHRKIKIIWLTLMPTTVMIQVPYFFNRVKLNDKSIVNLNFLENTISWGGGGYQDEETTKTLDHINWVVLQFAMLPKYYNVLRATAALAINQKSRTVRKNALGRFWRILRGDTVAGDVEPDSILSSWVRIVESQFKECAAEISGLLSEWQEVSSLWDDCLDFALLLSKKFVSAAEVKKDDPSFWYPKEDDNRQRSHRRHGALFSVFWKKNWNYIHKFWELDLDPENTRLCFREDIAPRVIAKYWKPFATEPNIPTIKLKPDPENLVIKNNTDLIKSAIIRWLFDPDERFGVHDRECITIDPSYYEERLIISDTVEVKVIFKGVGRYENTILTEQFILLWSVARKRYSHYLNLIQH